MKFWTALLIISFSCLSVFAQKQKQTTHIPGDILIQLEENESIENFIQHFNNIHRQVDLIRFVHSPSANFNIHLLHFNPGAYDENFILSSIQKQRQVNSAQFNHKLEFRETTPNDSSFGSQTSMNIIDAPKAWDITTGGLTANGDTIVVAVLDGGCQLDHPDLVENIWHNPGEIPDDEIDNDGNGYVDDYFGLHLEDSTDNHPSHPHGTSVAGIVGAKGNNNIGVAGINWNVKLLIISDARTDSELAEAYNYVFELRKKYNETNGAEGAFVVATNYSLGVNNAACNKWEMLNDMITKLGEVGILSAAATANNNWDVDEVGDIPTSCDSEFLIAVTNTTANDTKATNAAYGTTSIDLGAPGSASFTTRTNSTYASFNGTSGATPHIAGAIALLYSVPCVGLADQALDQPEETARLMKRLILDGVDVIPDLNGRTVSNGRLNIFNSMALLQEEFGKNIGSLSFVEVWPNPVTQNDQHIFLRFQTPDFTDYNVKIYNALGQLVNEDMISEICAPSVIDLDVSSLPNGVYFASIENDDDISSVKFMIAR